MSKIDYLYITQLEKPIPFLYSKSQNINLEEGKETYYLKFNAKNYHDETLLISFLDGGYIVLDKCSMRDKELSCPIGKSKLEEYYLPRIRIRIYYPYSNGETIYPLMIDRISVNYKPTKIDLKIKINKSLENYFDTNNFFAYEAEAIGINIPELISNIFYPNFTNADGTMIHSCCFKKTIDNSLYLLCMSGMKEVISLD